MTCFLECDGYYDSSIILAVSIVGIGLVIYTWINSD